jgi:carbamoylphosphate synthase large subunit
VEALNSLCRSLDIQAVIPASESEITVLSRLGDPPRLGCGAAVVCQPARHVDIFGDKLRSMQALEGAVELAAFADGSDRQAVERLIERAGFPVVVKSRRASGSAAVHVARGWPDLERRLAETPCAVMQQHVTADGGEFSVGVFRSPRFQASVVFRRELAPQGCSVYAESTEDPEVQDYVERLMRATDLEGSVNVQVRKGAEGVRLLEINPRFSSLVALRALCGFRDAEWSVRMALGWPIEPPAGSFRAARFQRFFHELVDLGEGFAAVAEWSPRLIQGGS